MYLSWHVHEEHCSHRSLSLTVSLIRPVDGVGLQDPVQILLPAGTKQVYPTLLKTSNIHPSPMKTALKPTEGISFLPVATTGSKHLVERELSVEIFLYNVQPLGLSRLSLQLLQ